MARDRGGQAARLRAEGQRQARASGLRAGGRAPYGLVLERVLVGGRPRTRLAVGDRREVTTLRTLARFALALNNDARAVAAALRGRGVHRRGRRWTAQDVRRALATMAYARLVPGWPRLGVRDEVEVADGVVGGDATGLTQPFARCGDDAAISGDGAACSASEAGIRAVGLTQPCGSGGNGAATMSDRSGGTKARIGRGRPTQPYAHGGDGEATNGDSGAWSASEAGICAARLTQPYGMGDGGAATMNGGSGVTKGRIGGSRLTQPYAHGGDGAAMNDDGGAWSASEAGIRAARLTQPYGEALNSGNIVAKGRISRSRLTQPYVEGGDDAPGAASGAARRGSSHTRPDKLMPAAAVVVLSERSASKAEKHAPDLTQPCVATVARRVRCGHCGSTMRQRVTSARTGPPRRYYACTSGDRGRPCGARWWRKETLETVMREEDSERAGGVGGEEAGLKGTQPSELEAVLERLDGLGAQLAKVEQALAALAGAGLTMEGVLGAIERLEGTRFKGPQAKKLRVEDEDDGLTALTALVVAGLRALVMLVPELPVTSTIAAKVLGIQRVKLEGRGVDTKPFGRAHVASISEWMTAAESVFPPHPGVGLLWLPRGSEQSGDGRRGR
jgi:hypothetical protein